MGDVYRRSGRGGAGNFYSQKDVAEIEKRAVAESKADLEAQKPSAPVLTTTTSTTNPSSSSAQPYARSGRGGAGNHFEASSAAAAAVPPLSPASLTTAPRIVGDEEGNPLAPVARRPGAGLSGRGGAGNWSTSDGGGEEEEERQRREALDRSILQGVQSALPREPPPIYHLHGGISDVGRKRVRGLSD